jgi:hypothetical protein
MVGGLLFLFAADDILPRLIPAFPPSGAWLGQLLAAAWLGVAMLNWFSRSTLLGGIYGRAVVTTNAVLYFVSAMALLKIVTRPGISAAVWLLAVPFLLFAGVYGWLMFRGPFERDFEMHRRAQQGGR